MLRNRNGTISESKISDLLARKFSIAFPCNCLKFEIYFETLVLKEKLIPKIVTLVGLIKLLDS